MAIAHAADHSCNYPRQVLVDFCGGDSSLSSVGAPFLLLALDCGTLIRQMFVLQSLFGPSDLH